jgi:tetratricopeptide (TPR) repeat protein
VDQVYHLATRLHTVDSENDIAVLAIAEHLCAIGDSAEATRLLRTQVTLYDELGRQPPLGITSLLNRLERGLVPTIDDPAVDDRAVGSRPIRAEVFLGREQELIRLESLWSSAREGGLVTSLVTGTPGIGKSTLIRRFATGLAARGWPVCLVRCQEMGRNIPFAAVSDLTLQLAKHPDAGATDSDWLSDASRVTPRLRTVYDGVSEPQPTSAEAVRLLVVEALFQMLEVVRDGGPLLLAFDDVQHIDVASCEVMHLIIRRLERSPVLLLATAGDRAFRRLPPEISGLVEWQNQIQLDPLDNECTRKMIGALASGEIQLREDVCSKIAELSRGNPYLTEMLVSDWRNNAHDSLVAAVMNEADADASWHPPQTMRRAFLQQYQGLSGFAERTLHILAVAGRSISIRELEHLLKSEDSSIDQAVLELIDRAIIRTSNGALGFTNELHRAFVYFEVMSQEARTFHHARLGEYLGLCADEHDFQRALEASHHFLKAGMINDAVKAACVGADLAITRGAPKEAEKALQGVECSTERAQDIDLLLARAFSAQQRFQESLTLLSYFNTAEQTAEAPLILTLRAEALHRGRLADTQTIREVANEAIRASHEAGNHQLTLKAQQVFAEIAYENGWWEEIRNVEAMSQEVARTATNTETRALALFTFGYCRLASGDIYAARTSFSSSSNEFERLGHHPALHRALNGLGICYTRLGDCERAVLTLNDAIQVAERSSDLVASANSHANLGAVLNESGAFYKAAEAFAKAMAVLSETTNPRVRVAVYCNAAILSIMIGSFAEAADLLELAEAAANRSRIWQHSVSVLLTQADLHLAVDQQEAAWELVDQAVSITAGRTHLIPDYGQYYRLRRHFSWAAGYNIDQELGLDTWTMRSGIGMGHCLEGRAFDEWVAGQDAGQNNKSPTAANELIDRQLFGILARLASVKILPTPLPAPLDGESGASLVARVFPEREFGTIPASVGEVSNLL